MSAFTLLIIIGCAIGSIAWKSNENNDVYIKLCNNIRIKYGLYESDISVFIHELSPILPKNYVCYNVCLYGYWILLNGG